jgi:hypothetical protein
MPKPRFLATGRLDPTEAASAFSPGVRLKARVGQDRIVGDDSNVYSLGLTVVLLQHIVPKS